MPSAYVSETAKPERVDRLRQVPAHEVIPVRERGRSLTWRPFTGAAAALVLFAALSDASDAHRSSERTLTAMVAAWPTDFLVTGTKTEPTYIEHVRFGRRGDLFGLEIDIVPQGNIAGGRIRTVLSVSPQGVVTEVGCGRPACEIDQPPHGFLATAWVLALQRRGDLRSPIRPRRFAGRSLVCLDDSTLETAQPVMDPCLDSSTGGALAQLSRLDPTQFAGPTLDATGIGIEPRATDDLFVPSPEDKPG